MELAFIKENSVWYKYLCSDNDDDNEFANSALDVMFVEHPIHFPSQVSNLSSIRKYLYFAELLMFENLPRDIFICLNNNCSKEDLRILLNDQKLERLHVKIKCFMVNTRYICHIAANLGQLDIIKALYSNNDNQSIVLNAIDNGHLHIIKYISEQHNDDLRNQIYLVSAIRNKQIECFDYFFEKNIPITDQMSMESINNPYMFKKIFIHYNQVFIPINLFVKHGNVECFIHYADTYLRYHDYQTHIDEAINLAIVFNKLEFVEELVDKCYPSNILCDKAAKYGNIEILRCLFENGHYFSSNILTIAATNGHYNCLNYVFENGADTQGISSHIDDIQDLQCLAFIKHSGFLY